MEGSNKCFRCKNFSLFYTKGVKNFNKTKFGWCIERQSVVSTQDGCEKYAYKPCIRRSNLMIKNCLNGLLTEITGIREMLEAERNDNKDM